MDGYSLCYIAVIHGFHNHWMTTILESRLPKTRPLLEMRFLCGSPSGFSTRFKAAKCWKAVFFWGSEMHTPFQHGIYIYIYDIIYIFVYIYI